MRVGRVARLAGVGVLLSVTSVGPVFLSTAQASAGIISATHTAPAVSRPGRGVTLTQDQLDAISIAGGGLSKAESQALATASEVSNANFITAIRLTNPAGVVFLPNMGVILMTEKQPSKGHGLVYAPITTSYDASKSNSIVAAASKAGVAVRISTDSKSASLLSIMTWLMLLIITGYIVAILIGRVRGNSPTKKKVSGGFGKNVANKNEGEIPTTRFTDVAGNAEAVEELNEMVEFLKDPDRYSDVGAKPVKGALLSGPPGTGKTLLARAVAGEAGVAFFPCVGSEFNQKYIGVGAQRVREIFEKARACDKAIIFIDEIDALARSRSGDEGGSGDRENDATLVQLLSELDGFVNSHVVVIAATNRADVLDEALTRPGRLERKISVPEPDRRGRTEIFEIYFKNRPIDSSVDPVHLARRTPGMTGADIASIVNEACLVAGRAGLKVVSAAHFDSAIATVAMGRARKSALVTEHDRVITAWHEAGHTICALLQKEADDPVAVSIIPRGPAGGVTWMGGSDDQFTTRKKAQARLVTSLGGRAAEMMLMDGEFTQGASSDLDNATKLAMAMVTQYGMSSLGLMVRSSGMLSTGGEVMSDVIEVVEEMLEDALNKARSLLEHEKGFMKLLVDELLDKENLSYDEIKSIYDSSRKGRAKKSAPAVVPPTPVYDAPKRVVESTAKRRVRGGLGDVGESLGRRVRKPRKKVEALAASAKRAGSGSKRVAKSAAVSVAATSKKKSAKRAVAKNK